MAWRMSGTYVASCNCQLICPCPTDGPPTGPNGECHGLGVFQIADGNHARNLFGQDWRGSYQQFDSSCSSTPFLFDFNFDRDGFTTVEHLIAIFVTDDSPEHHRRRLINGNRRR